MKEYDFPFLECCPAGGIDFEKSQSFVFVFFMSSKWQKTFIWVDLSIGSVLELLVLKNDAECTSQRLKWTSGAQVIIIFGRSVARSLGRSVARSLDRSIACSIARSLDRSHARSFDRLVITRHLFLSQDMPRDDKTCLAITRHVLRSQDMPRDHKTCLLITGHVT